MSEENGLRPSSWSVDTLKEYFESLLAEKDKALNAALIAVKEENRKTEVSAEKRFDLLNELRQGVATKEQMDALEKIVQVLSDRLNTSDGAAKGSQLTKGGIYAAIAAVGTILAIIVLLANGILSK